MRITSRHWADGGSTRLDNLMLLCRRHHRALHEGGFNVMQGINGKVAFVRSDGRRLDVVPTTPRWSAHDKGTLYPTVERLAAAGSRIGPCTATPCWDGARFDVVWAIDVVRGRERDNGDRRPPDAREAPCRAGSAEGGRVSR